MQTPRSEDRPRRRQHAPRNRLGCLTCRARKKRCDCAHPRCRTCTRLNLDCHYEQPRTLASAESPVAPSGPHRMAPFTADISMDQNQDKVMMLSYYVHEFVPSISVCRLPTSFYLSLYLPLAFGSDGVAAALIACASLHASRHSVDAARRERLKTLSGTSQRTSHRFLKERISMSGQPFKDNYEVVAVTLLLTGMEALSATGSRKWLQQLECIRLMLHNIACSQRASYDDWALSNLWKHFTYHDAMATAVYSPPRAALSSASPADGDSAPRSLPADTSATEAETSTTSSATSSPMESPLVIENIDPLMGCATSLFTLIARIRFVSPHAHGPELAATASFRELEQTLHRWRSYCSHLGSETGSGTAIDLHCLAEAYRLSALILLYRRVDTMHQMLPVLGCEAIRAIQRIPKSSDAEAGLTFPMFLAGAEARTESDMEYCVDRMESLYNRYKLENIRASASILKRLFGHRRSAQPDSCWQDFLDERQFSLSLT
jgi:transcriptional activator protein UGA3